MAGALAAVAALAVAHACATLSRFIPATIIFNLVIIVTHVPVVVNAALRPRVVHFALHALIFVSSLIVWMPLLSPLPEVPRLQPLAACCSCSCSRSCRRCRRRSSPSATTPLYKFYEHVPRLWGLSALDDMQLAGLIMKIGAGLLLWAIIAVVFFRWASEEERANTPRHGLDEMDRELTEMGLRR